MRENYVLTDSELIIEDEEMDLAICLPHPEKIEGKKHGVQRLFYESGTVRAEMFYASGVLHGPSVFFAETGKILAQTWYLQGKKMGKVKYFYPSGKLASVQRYKEGVCTGLQEYWYEDGKVKSLIPYVEGAMDGEVRLFWESGQLKRSCHYVRGVKEGWDRLWNPVGILIDEGQFHKGQPTGVHARFFPENGAKRQELNYHTPVRFDRREWDSAGELISEGVYATDLTYTERNFFGPHGATVRKGYWDGHRLCWK